MVTKMNYLWQHDGGGVERVVKVKVTTVEKVMMMMVKIPVSCVGDGRGEVTNYGGGVEVKTLLAPFQ